MKNYIFSEEDVIQIAQLGIMKCSECNQYELQSLDMNRVTNEKYMVCYKCFKAKKITQKEFDNLLMYSKNIPQNKETLIEIWSTLLKLHQKHITNYYNETLYDSEQKNKEELYKIILNEIKSKYNDISPSFLENITKESINFFMNTLVKKNEISTDKIKEKNINSSVNKINSKKELNIFMKENYQKTISNILDEEPKLFDKMYINFETIVSDNNNSAIIRDYNNIYENVSTELFSIKIVNSLCHLYKFIKEIKEGFSETDEYYIDKMHRVEFEVDSEEVKIIKISGSLFMDEGFKVTIMQKAFENILGIFSNENIEKHKEQDLFHANLICDFINKKYYKYGPDLGTAIFIYKNKKHFNKYIYDDYDYRKIISLIKKIKEDNQKNKLNQLVSNYNNENIIECNNYEENSGYTIDERIYSSNAIWGFSLSLVALLINIVCFVSFYFCYKALSDVNNNNFKGKGITIFGIVISSLLMFKYIYVLLYYLNYLFS